MLNCGVVCLFLWCSGNFNFKSEAFPRYILLPILHYAFKPTGSPNIKYTFEVNVLKCCRLSAWGTFDTVFFEDSFNAIEAAF